MKRGIEGTLLRIYIGDADRKDGQPLYDLILRTALDKQLAGATVLRGVMSYGRSNRIHSSKLLEASSDMPILIEVIDQSERIEAFLPFVRRVVSGGLITTESVEILRP